MSNVYSLLFLVMLLAYGLFNVPVYLWKYADHKFLLYRELEVAHTTRKAYRDAQVEFYILVNQCKNLINTHKTGLNAEYMDLLEK